MLVDAMGAMVLVPIIYSAGTAHGASWLEWDATNVYVERLGGFVVVLASSVICAAMILFAFATDVVVTVKPLGKF